MNAFSRSWEITKASFSTIQKDKEILLFPIIGGIFSVLLLLAFIVPFIFTSVFDETQILFYVLWVVYYFVVTFISVYSNVGVVYIALQRFSGKDPTFSQAVSFANSRLKYILTWSAFSAVVGLLLKMMERSARNGSGGLGMLIARYIIGAAWGIATIFVIPVIAYENVGPINAIKRSFGVFTKTWGETAIRVIGLGLIQMVVVLGGGAVLVVLLFLMTAVTPWSLPVSLALLVIFFVGVTLVFSVANTVFNAALYQYATHGKMPGEFAAIDPTSLIQNKKNALGYKFFGLYISYSPGCTVFLQGVRHHSLIGNLV